MIRSTFFSFGEKLIKVLSGLITVFLVANLMGAEKYGQFQLVISYISIFSSFTMFGLPGIVSREMSDSKSITWSVIYSAVIIKILLSIISILILSTLIFFQIIAVNIYYYLILFLIPVFNSHQIFNSYLETKNKSLVFLKNSVIVITIGLFTRLCVYFFNLSIDVFLIIHSIEIFLFFLFNLISTKKDFLNIKPKFNKNIINKVSYFGFASIAFIIVGNIDQVILKYFYNDIVVGTYSLAYKIILFLYLFLTPLSNGVVKKLKANINDYKLWEALLSLNFILGLIIILLYFSIVRFVILGFLSDDFIESIKYLDILIFAIPFFISTIPLGKWLLLKNQGKIFFKRALISVFINFILNIIFIQYLNETGVVYGTICTYLWLSVISIFIEPELLDLKRCYINSLKNIFMVKKNFRKVYE